MLDSEKNAGVLKPYVGNRAVQWNQIDISELPTIRMSRSDMEQFRLREDDLLACEGRICRIGPDQGGHWEVLP